MESFGGSMIVLAALVVAWFLAGAFYAVQSILWYVAALVGLLIGTRIAQYARVATDPVIVSLLAKRDERAVWEGKKG